MKPRDQEQHGKGVVLPATPWRATGPVGLTRQGLLAWLCVIGVGSTTAASPAHLNTFKSNNYTIYTNLSRQEAIAFGRHMDLIFTEYTRRFGSFRKRNRQSMPLYLTRTRAQYISLLGGFGFNASGSGGMFFYSSKANGLATWVEGTPRSFTLETLQHEGFHQFAHAYIGRHLPVWVNEGLAEYFGDGLIVGKKMKVGLATQRRVRVVQAAIRNQTTIDFDALLGMTGQQWHQNMTGGSPLGNLQYHQSWSLVYFLIHGDRGRYRKAFERYLILVNKGRHSGTAFRQAFGTQNTEAFRQRWEKYVLALEPDALTTAVARMRFLGRGMLYLHTQSKPIPTTLDALRQALKATKFSLTWRSHGMEIIVSAEDDSVYGFNRSNGSVGQFALLEAEGNGLLPRVAAPGLRPEPMLVWLNNHSGQLEPEIRYK